MPNISVDISDVERLGEEFERATKIAMRRVLLQGEALLVEEEPVDRGSMRSGTGSEFVEDRFAGVVYVAAKRDARGPRQGTLHLKSGATRTVTLRGTPEFNYPAIVAKGKPAQLAPKSAGAFLIPAANAQPPYITVDGRKYVVRKSIKAVPPNPFDDRAGKRLEEKIPAIFDKALNTVAGSR